MIAFIEFGRDLELGSKIKSYHALAPVAAIGHIQGGLKILSNIAPEVKVMSWKSAIACIIDVLLSGFIPYTQQNVFFNILEFTCSLPVHFLEHWNTYFLVLEFNKPQVLIICKQCP